MPYFVEDLLESVKSRSFVPVSQNTFQDADLRTIATEELRTKLVSDIISVREDFFLTSKVVSLTGGVAHYPVPKGAIGNSLKLVTYRDSANNEYNLSRVDVEQQFVRTNSTGNPSEYYFSGDEVVLRPTPASTTSGSVVFYYFKKPNQIIGTTSCAKITAVSSASGTTTFIVNTDLSASLSVGSTVDFLSAASPYLLWASDVAITAITSTTIAVATTDVVNEASAVEPIVNDYICPAGYSNIAQVPDEFHPVLAQMIAVRLLASLGDLNKWNAANAILKEMRGEALKLIKQRVEASPRRVINRGINIFMR